MADLVLFLSPKSLLPSSSALIFTVDIDKRLLILVQLSLSIKSRYFAWPESYKYKRTFFLNKGGVILQRC